MSIKTLIEWATDTVNFVWGCAKVSPACLHCYAVSIAMRFSKGRATWGTDGKRWDKSDRAIVDLLKIARRAKRTGERPRVFINSMSDTFEDHEGLQFPRINLFQCIETYPEIDFLLLTKRPENIMQMVPDAWHAGFPRNVWMGTTVENQETADKRIPELLKVPAAVRFLSCEPLLGPLDLFNGDPDPRLGGHEATRTYLGDWWEAQDDINGPCRHGVDWVICGGESGQQARPTHPDWIRSLRDQCQAADVPFFFKQWGEWIEAEHGDPDRVIDADGVEALSFIKPGCKWIAVDGRVFDRHEDLPEGVVCRLVYRVGKKASGRLLDGREWSQFPEVKP